MNPWTPLAAAPASPLAAAAIVCTLSVALQAHAVAEPPPVFSKLSFEEARAATKGTGKILVVKATAEWCGPCKMMDRTTWRNDEVVNWVKANGLAIQIDVDEEEETSQQLRVRAMPTMIAFRDGEEFDRVVGFREAKPLLEWFEAVKKGERASDALGRKIERAKAGQGKVSMKERMEYASGLVESGRLDKATEEYVWLWENMLKAEPFMVGVRASFMASEMQSLAEEHEPAREAFAALRDRTEERLKGEERSWDDLTDWITLNEVVDDPDRTLAWFDRIKDDPEAAESIEHVAYKLEDLLESHERWVDLTRIYKDPVGKLRQEHAQMRIMLDMDLGDGEDQDGIEEIRNWMRENFRATAGKLHGAYLAAERPEDAKKIAAEALKLDNTPEMRVTLVQAALDMTGPTPEMRKWLDEAEKAGHDVNETREALEAALSERDRASR